MLSFFGRRHNAHEQNLDCGTTHSATLTRKVLLFLEKLDENNQESIEMLRDMEGEIYAVEPAVCEANALEPITIEELGEKLRDMTVVIPYGVK